MRYVILLILAFPGLFGVGLHAQTASPEAGCFPLPVAFTAPAGSPGFFWDFQDGVTSQEQNPTHLFTGAGTFEVSFSHSPGGPVVGTVTVTVFARPDVQIALQPATACPGTPVTFTDLTVYPELMLPVNRLWTFGDGQTGTGANPVHIYTTAGVYSISLNMQTSLPGCSNTRIFTDQLEIYEPPIAGFTTDPEPPTVCDPPLTVAFTNTSSSTFPATLEWNFGNGQTFVGAVPPTQTYTESGNFLVTLTLTDENGCSASFSRAVSTGPGTLPISIKDTICVNLPLIITNLAPSGFHAWNFGPSGIPLVSNQRNPVVTFSAPGIANISYTWTSANGNCSVDTTFSVVVETEEIDFVAQYPEPYCGPPIDVTFEPTQERLTFMWNFDQFGESTDRSPVINIPVDPYPYSFFSKRDYAVSLVWASTGGCNNQVVREESYHQPLAWFWITNQEEKCAPNVVTFSDQSEARGILRWTWSFGDGQELTYTEKLEEVQHTYDTCGIFEVTLTIEDTLGCITTSLPDTVRVCCDGGGGGGCNCVPLEAEVCHGDTVFFQVFLAPDVVRYRLESDHYRLWHCSDRAPDETEVTIPWVFDHEPGFHDVHLSWETDLGYRETITYPAMIRVKGAWARADYLIDCANPFTVSFRDSSLNATHRLWTFPDGTTYTSTDFQHTFSHSGDYVIYLSAWNEPEGCPPSLDSVTVHIRNLKADFTVQENACQGALVPLDATASRDVNATCHKGYTWYFSQGPRPMTLSNPDSATSFGLPCKNDVFLVVEDINGCRDTTMKSVNVEQVNVSIEPDRTRICLPATIRPKALVDVTCGTLDKLAWNLGGITILGEEPEITIPAGYPVIDGKIIILLTAESTEGCKGGASLELEVYEPISFFTVEPSSSEICAGDAFTFNATDFTEEGSFLNFDWNFGNGTSGSGQQVVAPYPAPGVFTVTLTYTEQSSGCQGTTEREVQVQAFPIPDFSSNLDSLPVLCHPLQAFFQDRSQSDHSLQYQWDFGNGAPIATNPNPSAVFGKGTFTVSLTVTTPAGCASTVEKTYTFTGPEGSLSFDKSAICLGEPITLTLSDTVDVGNWEWFFEGVTYPNVNPVTHTYSFRPPSGQTFAKIILSDKSRQCTLADSLLIPLVLTTADFVFGDGPYCPGGDLSLLNASQDADTYQWTFSSGPPSSATDPVVTLPAQVGPFTVNLTAINGAVGCRDSLSRTIQVTQISLPPLLGDTICPGDTARIGLPEGIAGLTWTWSPATGVLDPDSAFARVLAPESTTYTLTGANDNGCLASGSAGVVVLQPIVLSDWDTTVVTDASVVLPGPQGVGWTYQWGGEGLSCTDCPNPVYVAVESREFTLVVSDILGCFSDEAVYVVNVVPDEIELPNLFTPNGDGTNDFFQIIVPGGSLADIAVMKLRVYNRWGNLVYDNDNPDKGWDGNHKGKPAPSDVYAYVVEVTFYDGRTETYRGDITLLR